MTDLDHVAIATLDVGPAITTLVGDLGGVLTVGGNGYGFRWVQVRMGDTVDGMTIELLVAWQPEVNDFLARFLTRHGPGQHHLTFKVKDLAATLERVRRVGLTPVNVNLTDPHWKEAFLVPREAHGTVVQLAQVNGDHPDPAAQYDAAVATGGFGEPRWWPDPPPRSADRAVLHRVVLATPALAEAVDFFAHVLDGEVTTDADDHAELVWPGGGRVRLEEHAAMTAGFHRLEGDRSGAPTTASLSGTPFVIASR